MQEARELIALAEEKGQLLSVFHNRRWDSDYLGVRRAIEQGLVGRVVQFESHIDRFRPQVRVRWREQNVPGSGLWFDLGPHLIDRALQLFGLPESVQGNIATLREQAEVNDWAHVVLNYPEHRVILHCSMLVAGGVSRFSVHGDKGSLIKAHADRRRVSYWRGDARQRRLGRGRRRDGALQRRRSAAPATDASGRSASVLYTDRQRAERSAGESGAAAAGAGGNGGAGSGGKASESGGRSSPH